MILDSLATFESSRASTVAAASTDHIDTLASGDAYVNAWYCAQITTAATISNGAPTCTFQLQTSNDSSFLDVSTVTLVASAAFVAADMTAGKIFSVRIPPNVKRYLRGYRSIAVGVSNNFSALACSQFIVADNNKVIGTPRYAMGTTIGA